MPKALDQDSPKLMPPRDRGETFIDAVGDKIRCQPNGFVGLGGGSNGCMALSLSRMTGMTWDRRFEILVHARSSSYTLLLFTLRITYQNYP